MPCLTSADCDDGQYCATAAGQCGGPGTCQDTPAVCPQYVSTVCGCDGQDYGNSCFAEAQGVSVDHAGSCQTQQTASPATCLTNDDCDATQYCAFADGACGGVGSCQSRGLTVLCMNTTHWVCGCDGTTYANPCVLHKAGVSLDAQGGCACQADSDCAGMLPAGCSAWSCVDGACQGVCGASN